MSRRRKAVKREKGNLGTMGKPKGAPTRRLCKNCGLFPAQGKGLYCTGRKLGWSCPGRY